MKLTPRVFAYLAHEEGIVQECYLDTNGVQTWAIGLTAASGIKVSAYLNRPASVETCVRASIDVLNAKYLPEINKVFAGYALNDAQLAAVIGFHWNTGAIGHADWVKDWTGGNMAAARRDLTTNYTGGGALLDRRKREATLMFENAWPAQMQCPLWAVSKPGYRPINPHPVDLTALLQQILGVA